MLSPSDMSFCALIATAGFLFIIWHTWHYDGCRCLLYSKRDWFRALMCQILLLSVMTLLGYTWIEVKVSYDEYYVYINGKTMPAPWQLWSEHNQTLWRASLYLLCAGWSCIQSVHLEEFLYWGYLIYGIRNPGSAKWSWRQSPWFKIWLIASLCTFALMFGASHIETQRLDMMKTYIFLVGSSMSCVLAIASIILCIVFPSFVEGVKKQGATYEVLERLHFFSEMNQIRTFFRCVYAVAFLVLATDGMTDAKKVIKSGFWSEFLYLSAHLALFISTLLSVVVLLPRNMTSESLPHKSDTNIHPMMAYQRPSLPENPTSPRQYYELGDRLNIDRDTLKVGLEGSDRFEMEDSPRMKKQNWGEQQVTVDGEENHDRRTFGSSTFDERRRTRMSQMPSLPAVMAKFKSPFETASPTSPKMPTQVYVTTSQSVHHS